MTQLSQPTGGTFPAGSFPIRTFPTLTWPVAPAELIRYAEILRLSVRMNLTLEMIAMMTTSMVENAILNQVITNTYSELETK